jgi:hypothetical protein
MHNYVIRFSEFKEFSKQLSDKGIRVEVSVRDCFIARVSFESSG